ncbi:hypothetical protein MCUN1_000086 [Malassezia cuniculi]|uniref:Major facilitator superfamily (MFS) profile domain-containing protein n=1 Tax=Malassezia cuniculi TaxID=948313 RepID=A0AAF0EMD1_9BASI|nr:hypothetical protein MCUN1_000086 [Malassezia cuniculi]
MSKQELSPDKQEQNEAILATRDAILQEAGHDTNDLDQSVNVRLANPLLGLTPEKIRSDVHNFAQAHNLEDYEEVIFKGALCAQSQATGDYRSIPQLDEHDHNVLAREQTHRWSQPFALYWLAICCSVAAAVQGADESVISGAILFFPQQFCIDDAEIDPNNISASDQRLLDNCNLTVDGWNDLTYRNAWLKGLVAAAPYVACAFAGCWLTEPLNHFFGRRGTIFIGASICFATCIWQGVTNTWWHLFISRLVLGLGIGPNSATVPMYAAECAPPLIRGALTMQWQTWTAFGIMLGYCADLVLLKVSDVENITGLNWRLMLASACIPALFLMAQVFLCPESPRWLMKKNRYRDALQSFLKLRADPLLAARDLYFAHCLIEEERRVKEERGSFPLLELFTIPRNARATIASLILMFGQQFCGVNVIAYYSSSIIKAALKANSTNDEYHLNRNALLGSWGFGMINFLFAIPAWYLIDTFGRRNLLLSTLPFMVIFLLLTGFAFWIPEDSDARLAVVLLGIFLYGTQYSPGFGPVPLTYAAEAFPLYVREVGMALSTSVLWFFNALLAITWFAMLNAFSAQGAFGWYAAWCAVLWFLVLLFMPETKSLSLEELDIVFGIHTTKHAAYQVRQTGYFVNRYLFRNKNAKKEQLYTLDDSLRK